MGKSHQRPTTWREALELMTRCPVCQAPYPALGARLCAKDEHASKVHLTCGRCGNFALVIITLLAGGISSVGMTTDLSFGDIKRLQSQDAISADDLIEGYEFFKTNVWPTP